MLLYRAAVGELDSAAEKRLDIAIRWRRQAVSRRRNVVSLTRTARMHIM